MLRGRRGEDWLATFLRGLVAGAFVGAAVAGSAAWRRIRRRRVIRATGTRRH